jgi:hypothetical protein
MSRTGSRGMKPDFSPLSKKAQEYMIANLKHLQFRFCNLSPINQYSGVPVACFLI